MARSWLDRIQKTKRPDALIGKMTDRLAELAPEMERLQALKAEVEDIKAALEHHANDVYEEDSEVSFVTDAVEVDFTARCIVRKIKDMPGLMKKLGREVFLQHVTFPLKELDNLMPRAEQKKFVSSKRTGPRVCRIKMME